MVKSPEVMLFQAVESLNKQEETTTPVKWCRTLFSSFFLIMVNDERNLNWLHRTKIFVFAAIICDFEVWSQNWGQGVRWGWLDLGWGWGLGVLTKIEVHECACVRERETLCINQRTNLVGHGEHHHSHQNMWLGRTAGGTLVGDSWGKTEETEPPPWDHDEREGKHTCSSPPGAGQPSGLAGRAAGLVG